MRSEKGSKSWPDTLRSRYTSVTSGNRMWHGVLASLSAPGFPWGHKGFLYGFDSFYSKSYNAILYGQVSYDRTVSQLLRMVHSDLRKSHKHKQHKQH